MSKAKVEGSFNPESENDKKLYIANGIAWEMR